MSKKSGLADPTRLKPFDLEDKQLLRVVIETPKGSRNKSAFDPDQHVLELKKVLPAGMTFPDDFGFVPSAEADDGDPVDVLAQRFSHEDPDQQTTGKASPALCRVSAPRR
jgi:inorganic pyrophosphatase